MPNVIIDQPVEGKMPGQSVNVPAARADWLVAEGYAHRPGGEVTDDATYSTSVEAGKHPMLAENREGPNEDVPAPKGEGNAPELTEDPVVTLGEQRALQEAADKESEAVVESTKDLLAPEEIADEVDTSIQAHRARQAAADDASASQLEGAADVTAPEQVEELPRTLPRDTETKAAKRAAKRSGGAAKAAEAKPSE